MHDQLTSTVSSLLLCADHQLVSGEGEVLNPDAAEMEEEGDLTVMDEFVIALIGAVYSVHDVASSRERSLALTKLEEAGMWMRRAAIRQEA